MIGFSDLSAAVSGTQGWITLPTMFWVTTSLEIHAGDVRQIFGRPERVDLPQEGNGYVPMIRAVVDAIDRGLLESPVHPASDTVAVFRVLDEIRAQLVAEAARQDDLAIS
jgi:hypothetical protein